MAKLPTLGTAAMWPRAVTVAKDPQLEPVKASWSDCERSSTATAPAWPRSSSLRALSYCLGNAFPGRHTHSLSVRLGERLLNRPHTPPPATARI